MIRREPHSLPRLTEGFQTLKNIHSRLFVVILALLVGALFVVFNEKRFPTRFGLDIQGGMRVVLQAQTDKVGKGYTWKSSDLDITKNIIETRVNGLGVAEPVITTKPQQNQIVVELPGLKNKEEALQMINQTARLEFRSLPQLDNGTWHISRGDDKTAYEQLVSSDGKPVSEGQLEAEVFSRDPILTGADLEPNSYVEITTKGPVIHFEFKSQAKETFADYTSSHTNKALAIFLDRKLISAPNINGRIAGIGIIEGSFTPESAKQLSSLLNAGALPVPLEQVQVTNIEATLGREAVNRTLLAGAVGLGIVLLFMLGYYKLPGLLADIALLFYAVFTFAIFKGALAWMGLPAITLTVPGIAGFILSIGMAVDANILIFERLKEEMNAGRPLRAAIEQGFKRAFTAIFDSNMCTLITCYILYVFGTSQVRGFALTLAIGVLVSLFTAITCSRTLLLLVAGTKAGQNPNSYGVNFKGLHPKLDVTKKMKFWFGLSGAIIVPGLIFLAIGGLKPGIEFVSGTEITAQFNKPVSVASVTKIVTDQGQKEPRVVMADANTVFVNTRQLKPEEQKKLTDALVAQGATIQGTDTISSTVSTELLRNAITAVIAASVLIMLYLALRFSLPNFVEGLKFGASAIAAMLHDVLVVLGMFAIFGALLGWQIDSLFVTAMLTVIGFSVHDTIIIFDRIRENLQHKARGESFGDVTDRSIEQTFARSINTSLTVVITLVALLLFGGPTIRLFVTALLIGIVSGTYSSIFNASPLLVLWKRRNAEAALATTAGSTARTVAPRPVGAARPRVAPTTGTVANGPINGSPRTETAITEADEDDDGSPGSAERLRKKRKRRM